MILMIDNYDSFTYNLVQYLGEMGQDLRVVRNDAITIAEIKANPPAAIVLSPGPGNPDEAGICLSVVKELAGEIPILGVCLGHQTIAQAYGGHVVRSERLMHGKTSLVHHDNKTMYEGIAQPFVATRYHSLIVEKESLPEEFEISAFTEEGEIMGIRHRNLPIEGVQFHPESILSEAGKQLLSQFLRYYVVQDGTPLSSGVTV
ncbi:aminodeoxychorismate/anthranilate synthase component II [Mechercharimyces sp. CAU 1602]|uniref:anthranilate synthase component II n=1 Tax=Mechercharimyces sp. CAU 1602 TaxID=2973933 RepID=UPI002163EABB|nr:aminodeoxychorismate/anthranilate synthase component II [Mechercharimyces sp. CAU 1602]MCS1352400.1 aminodeoxychorismate/anthranilate synthase component II [Mechercharimyces sp. CAU 1602]